MTRLNKIVRCRKTKQVLFPITFEGKDYYVRFVRRGLRVDISGVFKFEVMTGRHIVPQFTLQNKQTSLAAKVMREARVRFNEKLLE